MNPVTLRRRNVIIWDLNNNQHRTPLGGLILTPGITHKDFREMLDILLITSADLVVQNEQGQEVLRDSQPLLAGDYTVVADKVQVSFRSIWLKLYQIFF